MGKIDEASESHALFRKYFLQFFVHVEISPQTVPSRVWFSIAKFLIKHHSDNPSKIEFIYVSVLGRIHENAGLLRCAPRRNIH